MKYSEIVEARAAMIAMIIEASVEESMVTAKLYQSECDEAGTVKTARSCISHRAIHSEVLSGTWHGNICVHMMSSLVPAQLMYNGIYVAMG